jgi:hypothetical protein
MPKGQEKQGNCTAASAPQFSTSDLLIECVAARMLGNDLNNSGHSRVAAARNDSVLARAGW